MVTPGEVLVARSNTPELVGRAAMFLGNPNGVVASDLTIRVLPGDSLKSEFLAGYLSHLYLSGYWKEPAGGASGSMKKITRTQIQDEPIPIPSPLEQQSIVTHISKAMAQIRRTKTALEDQLATINSLPAALLRLAFSGDL